MSKMIGVFSLLGVILGLFLYVSGLGIGTVALVGHQVVPRYVNDLVAYGAIIVFFSLFLSMGMSDEKN